MIKYHGTPITPREIFKKSVSGKNVLISYAHPHDLNNALKYCNKICLDNGAFSFWTKGKDVDWDNYYKWVEDLIERIEFFIIPDVIDGTEKENDNLIDDFHDKFYYNNRKLFRKGIPVWHVAESLERLKTLADNFDYICFGSSGEFSELGTDKWYDRMNEAMKVVCNKDGIPQVKIHMLRCLNPKIFTKFPFYSGDSTNLARNHSRDGWYQILSRIEKYNSPDRYKFRLTKEQGSLF